MSQLIRRAGEKDLKAVFAIETAVQEAPWAESAFADFQRDEDVYFYLVDDEQSGPIAFIIAIAGDDFLEILNFAVKPVSQGQGSGSKLFKYVLNEAAQSGIKAVRLEVREGNEPALAIYKKNGMKIVGLRKNYYSDGENALLMSGEIPSV
ncbi:MAG: ribosomal protein S18-alanine N-acetyltransferase [Eubacteriales bacterium]|nr:ribosomal protein S18-alanine N-acetyltransferase [Eubacteriales bacterium]MDD4541268.1 ribosomal protein S18-alanine N-acetyltransferase [Eubacteriales bacterium]